MRLHGLVARRRTVSRVYLLGHGGCGGVWLLRDGFCFTLLLGSRATGCVDPMAPKQRLPHLQTATWGVGHAASPGTNHFDLLWLI